jgi:hypothetical protein
MIQRPLVFRPRFAPVASDPRDLREPPDAAGDGPAEAAAPSEFGARSGRLSCLGHGWPRAGAGRTARRRRDAVETSGAAPSEIALLAAMKNLWAVSTFAALSVTGALTAMACGGSIDTPIPDPSSSVSGTDPAPSGAPADSPPGANTSTPGAAPGSTSTPPGAPSAFACGASSCTAGVEECCVSASGGGGGAAEACVAKGACAGAGKAALSCSGTASCGAGDVCCLDVTGGGGGGLIATATCKASCTGSGGGRPQQLCASNSECKSGNCQATQLSGVKVCANGGGGGGGGGGKDAGKPNGG